MNGGLSFLASHCFIVLAQRISKCDDIQEDCIAQDKVLNVLIYGSLRALMIFAFEKLSRHARGRITAKQREP